MSQGPQHAEQDTLYQSAMETYGAEIARFVHGYERNPARRRELLQEVHVAIWRSFAGFKAQCSLRTWVYRVAHNVGASHVQRSIRAVDRMSLDIDEAATMIDERADIDITDRRIDLERLLAVIHRMAPLDRELILLYLEDLDAASIGEIVGLSARNVATKVHRIKAQLAIQLGKGTKS